MSRPNVLLIMTDQHRGDAVGFMGNEVVQTPHLDSMANRGVIFENAFVQCPVCMASRAAIHTGRYPSALGIRSMGLLPPTEVTLAETLKRAGYTTGVFGKLHFTPQEYTLHKLGTDRPIHDASVFLAAAGIDSAAMRAAAEDPYKKNYGFDVFSGVEDFQSGNYFEWLGERAPDYLPHAKGINWGLPSEREIYDREPHATHLFPDLGDDFYESRLPAELHPSWYIVEKTVEFIRDNRDRPFFAHCSFVDPHHPFNASPPYNSMYPPADMEVPPIPDARCYPDDLPPGVWSQIREQNGFPDEFWQWVLSNYYGMISHVDYCLGRLFAELRELDLERDTIVVFISDHGEYAGDHRLLRKGSLLFESLIHVPFFISWPGHLRSGERIDAMVQEIDLYPTLMSLVGLKSHSGVQGKDLSLALVQEPARVKADGKGATAEHAVGYDRVFCELDNLANPIFALPYFQPTQLVRSEKWKLICYPCARTGMLYDLETDPGETRNLYLDPRRRGIRDELFMDLLDHHHARKDPLPLRLSQA